MPRAPIGFYLVAMVVAVALPILAFVAILLMQLGAKDREALQRRTARDAQSLAMTVDRQLYAMATTLQLLANAPELKAGDLRSFQERTRASLNSNSLYLLVLRADGQQLINTRVDFGTPLNKTSNQAALDSAIKSGRPEASDVFFGKTSGKWVFNVTLPLPKEFAGPADAIVLTQNAEDLGRLFQTEGLPEGWSSAIVDSSGRVVYASDGTPPGNPFDPGLVSRMTGLGGSITGGRDAPSVAAGYARLHSWSWVAVVWGPLDAAQAPLVSTWRSLIFGGLLLVGLAIFAAFLVGRQLRNAIVRMSDMAVQLGRGEIVSPVQTRIEEVDLVAMALSEASFDRSQAEDRVRFVLHELAHRTKNMLSVIQAMIRQTARRTDNIAKFQETMGQRLVSLGRSIDLLTQEEWSGVSIRQLLQSHLSTFMEPGPRLLLSGDNFALRPEAVQNLGMALYELATNSVKYGAWSVPSGAVAIEWYEKANENGEPWTTLKWSETGGPRVSAPKRKGFGTIVVESQVAATFRGKVDMDYAPGGFVWTLQAPSSLLRWERAAAEDETRQAR